MPQDNTARLHDVFRQVFGLDRVCDDLTKNDIPGWNSLQTINLILALEETFGVSFAPEEAKDMVSVGIIKDILAEKGVRF